MNEEDLVLDNDALPRSTLDYMLMRAKLSHSSTPSAHRAKYSQHSRGARHSRPVDAAVSMLVSKQDVSKPSRSTKSRGDASMPSLKAAAEALKHLSDTMDTMSMSPEASSDSEPDSHIGAHKHHSKRLSGVPTVMSSHSERLVGLSKNSSVPRLGSVQPTPLISRSQGRQFVSQQLVQRVQAALASSLGAEGADTPSQAREAEHTQADPYTSKSLAGVYSLEIEKKERMARTMSEPALPVRKDHRPNLLRLESLLLEAGGNAFPREAEKQSHVQMEVQREVAHEAATQEERRAVLQAELLGQERVPHYEPIIAPARDKMTRVLNYSQSVEQLLAQRRVSAAEAELQRAREAFVEHKRERRRQRNKAGFVRKTKVAGASGAEGAGGTASERVATWVDAATRQEEQYAHMLRHQSPPKKGGGKVLPPGQLPRQRDDKPSLESSFTLFAHEKRVTSGPQNIIT